MTEYEMKFASLAHFVVAQLTNDVFKATRFEAGLRPNICRALASFPIMRYSNMVIGSLAIEVKEM